MRTTTFSRRSRRVLTGVAVLAATAGTTGAGLAGASTSSSHTLHLRAHQVSETVLALGHGPSQVGDEFIDHWAVTRQGHRAGTLETVCQVTWSSGESATIQCVGTLRLRHGELAVQGVGTATNSPTGNDFVFPVTGGSGAYRHARGEVRIHQASATDDDVTVDLG